MFDFPQRAEATVLVFREQRVLTPHCQTLIVEGSLKNVSFPKSSLKPLLEFLKLESESWRRTTG